MWYDELIKQPGHKLTNGKELKKIYNERRNEIMKKGIRKVKKVKRSKIKSKDTWILDDLIDTNCIDCGAFDTKTGQCKEGKTRISMLIAERWMERKRLIKAQKAIKSVEAKNLKA